MLALAVWLAWAFCGFFTFTALTMFNLVINPEAVLKDIQEDPKSFWYPMGYSLLYGPFWAVGAIRYTFFGGDE